MDGFEALAKLGPCISVFGSARTKPGEPHYELAVEIAKRLAEEGFGIISGGGPGCDGRPPTRGATQRRQIGWPKI